MCCRTGNGLFEGKLNKEIAIWVLYGLFLANYIGMPISALNGTGVDILMWVYPRMVPDVSHITALLEKYEFICMYIFLT